MAKKINNKKKSGFGEGYRKKMPISVMKKRDIMQKLLVHCPPFTTPEDFFIYNPGPAFPGD